MFSESAELYDLIYGEFKEFEAEAARITELIRERHPGAETVLDLGCGTGQHVRRWTDAGFEVDGVDIDEGFVAIAKERCPEGNFTVGDMADFDLGRSYDVVLSLFSSIGYVRTREALESTARCIRRHVAEDGMAIVEPWLTPETMHAGRCYLTTVDRPELKVARTSYNEIDGRISRIFFHYLVTTPEGTRHLEEMHEMGLFTHEEMREAFETAGLEVVEHDEEGLIGRGLWVLR